jgi:uncharacterized protein (DUF2267 family)
VKTVEGVETMTTGAVMRQGRTAARQWRVALRQSRRVRRIVQGARYRLARRGPDPLAGDDIVAERVRASLGLVSKRLDVPRAHVMVTGHVATLHGEVGTIAEALSLAGAAGAVPGVMAVRCRLHVGLLPGQGRPSQGRLRQRLPSKGLSDLLDAAARAGVGAEQAPTAVRAVVEAFAACLPAGERGRLSAGLPADLRRLALPRHRCRWTDQPADLLNCVAEVSGLGDLVRAERLTVAVLRGLSEILPPADAARIDQALAPTLRPLWRLVRRPAPPAGCGGR